MTKDLGRDPSGSYPNLTPGLSEADRELLAMIAGNTESIPALLDRWNKYTADLSAGTARVNQFALSDGWPFLTRRGNNRELQPGQPSPLLVDTWGRLVTTIARRQLEPIFKLTIQGGGTASQWLDVRATGLEVAAQLMIYDDRARLPGEIIALQVAYADTPDPAAASADAYTLQASVFAATVGTAVVVSGGFLTARHIRLLSGIGVGAAGRTFTLQVGSQ